jgi:hypothetical protein
MNEDRLTNLLGIGIVPCILKELGVSDKDYANELHGLYKSRLFALLSDPTTALWHLSPATLAQMYEDERKLGSFEIPEEQS